MNIIEQATRALALIEQGRQALEQVKDAVKDGRAAISTNEQAQLDEMLRHERQETDAAYQRMKDAIAASRA